jgi:hypothetical protein
VIESVSPVELAVLASPSAKTTDICTSITVFAGPETVNIATSVFCQKEAVLPGGGREERNAGTAFEMEESVSSTSLL